MLDRFFDNYVSTPQQKLVSDAHARPTRVDPYGGDRARAPCSSAPMPWLDAHLDGAPGRAGPSVWPTAPPRPSSL